mgnify:CR=1 FL=1
MVSKKDIDIKKINEKIEKDSAFIDLLVLEINKSIVGQNNMIERLLIGLLGQGHILLEGVPGLAKTLAINTLSKAVKADFSRIQFTPDLLPADVVGTMIYNIKENDFSIKKGPIFANFILADEINRAPAKVQSALLEAMQEKQVTIGDTTFKLQQPFLVMATQNPVEQEGTYPLPEAQLDRFMFKMSVGYPSRSDEDEILSRRIARKKDAVEVETITDPARVVAMQQAIEDVYVDPAVRMYMVEIVTQTREHNQVLVGSSPRGSQALLKTSRAAAAMRGRDFVTPDDVKSIANLAIAHRLILKPEHQIKGVNTEDIIKEILRTVPVPTV